MQNRGEPVRSCRRRADHRAGMELAWLVVSAGLWQDLPRPKEPEKGSGVCGAASRVKGQGVGVAIDMMMR
jgi:hypothetical protein